MSGRSFLRKSDSFTTVSYTHLDVYKRQALDMNRLVEKYREEVQEAESREEEEVEAGEEDYNPDAAE